MNQILETNVDDAKKKLSIFKTDIHLGRLIKNKENKTQMAKTQG